MLQSVFVTALTTVSALALAVVYGLGGFYALKGSLDPGAVVALALLLTRLYAPLTALASARVEIMSAVVSFERVFEVLDLQPLIREKPDAVAVPDGPVSVEFSHVTFAYPSADKVSLASLEEVAMLDNRGGVDVLHDVSFRVEPGQMVALVGTSGAGKSTIASLIPRLYDVDSGSVRLGGVDVRDLSMASLRETLGHGDAGRPPVPRVGPRQPPAGSTRRRPRPSCGRRCAMPGSTTSSPRCPTGSTRSSASAATGSPAANASGSRSPGCCWRTRGSSSSTRRPPTSTRRRSRPCRRRLPSPSPGVRPS